MKECRVLFIYFGFQRLKVSATMPSQQDSLSVKEGIQRKPCCKPPPTAAERGETGSLYGLRLEILAQPPRCGIAAPANKPASSGTLQKLQRTKGIKSLPFITLRKSGEIT